MLSLGALALPSSQLWRPVPRPVGIFLHLRCYSYLPFFPRVLLAEAGGLNSSFSPQLVNNWRGMPGFKATPSSPYNWSADYRQVKVLLGAKARGADYFEAFSNSPPWWMTKSGDVAGLNQTNYTLIGNGGNLRSSMEGAFAEYLTDVVQHFATEPDLNVTFQVLEPFNEPIFSTWFAGNGQEGCRFGTQQMSRVINKVYKALKRKKLRSKLTAYDESVIPTALTLGGLTPLTRLRLAKLNVHGYDSGPPAGISVNAWSAAPLESLVVTARTALPGRELWLSEWGPMRDGTELEVALFMTRKVMEYVNILKVSAFVYWQVGIEERCRSVAKWSPMFEMRIQDWLQTIVPRS